MDHCEPSLNMSDDISLYDVSRHCFVSAQHPNSLTLTPPKKGGKILSILGFGACEKCQQQWMWELFDKSSHRNKEHMHQCEKKKHKLQAAKREKKKSKELVETPSAFPSEEIYYPTSCSSFQPGRSSPCLASWLQIPKQIPWEQPAMRSAWC